MVLVPSVPGPPALGPRPPALGPRPPALSFVFLPRVSLRQAGCVSPLSARRTVVMSALPLPLRRRRAAKRVWASTGQSPCPTSLRRKSNSAALSCGAMAKQRYAAESRHNYKNEGN